MARRDANGKPILWKASISLGVVTIDGKRRRPLSDLRDQSTIIRRSA